MNLRRLARPLGLLSLAFTLQTAAAGDGLVEWQATLVLEGESKRNLELERDHSKHESELEPELRLRGRFFPGRPWWGLVEAEFKQQIELESGDPSSSRTRLNLTHAYVATDELLPDTRLRLGRWLQRDEREWLLDENLDGLHLDYEKGRWEGEFFVARVGHWRRDLLDRRTGRGDPVNQITAIGRYEVAKDWQVGAYMLYQHDVSRADARQTFTGLRSHGTADRGWRHWFELGHVGGRDDGRRIDGRVIDLGTTYVFDLAGATKARLTLGLAHATGDDRSGDAVDRGYRQTGMHSNEATYGGLEKLYIYGETLEPDLANLQVLTLGAGLDLSRRSSLDLVLHRYRQPVVGRLRGTDLDPEEDLRDRSHLGDAIDLVLGWRPRENVRFALAAGLFRPSARFRADNDDDAPQAGNAWSLRMELLVRF